MKYEKFIWLTLVQLVCLKECFSNSTRSIPTERSVATTINVTITAPPLLDSSNVTEGVKNESTHLELLKIFHGGSNDTTNYTNVVTENSTEVSAGNGTKADFQFKVLSWNDTLKTNYTLTSEVIASQEYSSFWLQRTGAIVAGVFLISSFVGYFGCVGYRRFMQKKYGNSQIVAGEDVYDTSDLRYFEI